MGDCQRRGADSGLWSMVILTLGETDGEDGGWIALGSHYDTFMLSNTI